MDGIVIKKSCLKRMLGEGLVDEPSYDMFSKILKLSNEDALSCVQQQVKILSDSFSSIEVDRDALKHAVAMISQFTRVEEYVHLIVQTGAVKILISHLSSVTQKNEPMLYEHEITRDCVFGLANIASKPEYQHLIVDAGALPSLVNLMQRYKSGHISEAGIEALTWASSAIMNLCEDNVKIQSLIRSEHGIPPLVKLLEFPDSEVQRVAAAALGTLSLNNEPNKTQIVECNALPALILLLYSEDATIHREAVNAIENLVHSSLENVIKALEAGALQPVIRLLSSRCSESQNQAALILMIFALSGYECKVHMVQRGVVDPLIKLVQSQDVELQEISAFVLGLLAEDNTHNQASIGYSGGILPLLNLLESDIDPVQQNAAYALCGLANDEDNVVDIITSGGVQKLQGGEFLVQETRDYVSATLENLEKKINGRVLSHLLYLMRVADRSIRGRIALALSHLCSPHDQKSIFIDNGGLDILLELLASQDIKLQQLASKALYILCPVDKGPTSLISQFNSGKEDFNNPRCSDVIFLIEGKRFYAHRTRLLAASDAFQAICGAGYGEKEAKEIEISNIRWEVFELMMRYIYMGSVHVSLNVVYDLLKAADEYLLDGLKRQCEQIIARDISVANVSLTYELSVALNASSLRDACFVFVLKKFVDLIALPGYHNLICRILPQMRNYFVRAISRPSQTYQ